MVEIKAPVSRWKQVAEYLKERILDGTFPAGQPLPSEQQLADEFGLSRPTIRNAINELKAVGLVEVKRPQGTFVRSTHARPAHAERRGITHAPDGYREVSDSAWHDADKPSFVRFNATLAHAELLGIPTGEPMLVRSVLQTSGDIRRVHRTYLPFSVAATTPWAENAALPDAHDIYAYFADTMPRLHWREHVRARMPLPDEAESLQAVPGTPVMQVIRLTLSKDKSLLMEEFIALGEELEVSYALPVTKATH